MANIEAGLTHTAQFEVAPRLTVPQLFPDHEATSKMPEVLATAYLVGLIERACMDLMAPHLEPGEGSLGIGIQLQHTAPTLEGMTVTIDVRCVASDNRKLGFEVEARDELSTIATATHDRAVVRWERFEGKLAELRDKLAER